MGITTHKRKQHTNGSIVRLVFPLRWSFGYNLYDIAPSSDFFFFAAENMPYHTIQQMLTTIVSTAAAQHVNLRIYIHASKNRICALCYQSCNRPRSYMICNSFYVVISKRFHDRYLLVYFKTRRTNIATNISNLTISNYLAMSL